MSRPKPGYSKSDKTFIYKGAVIIILVLLVFLLWGMYKRLPPEKPFQYPAYAVPSLRILG
jgi:hypothetical protein